MDLTPLPDLVQHFAIAVHFMPQVIQDGLEQGHNFIAAFGQHSPLSRPEKLYHAGKFVTLAGLFVATAMTWNVEGMLGTGLAEADEIYDLCREGQQARMTRSVVPPA